jgi:hypothetical protein
MNQEKYNLDKANRNNHSLLLLGERIWLRKKMSQKAHRVLLGTKNIVPCKKCIKCNIEKGLSEFHRNSSKSDGSQADCKVCVKIKKQKRYQRKSVKAQSIKSFISSKIDQEFLDGFAVAFSEGIKGLIESGELK